jgi:hypothetical protein
MSKSFKVAALLAVTAMFLAAPVFAPSVYGQSSPTGTATAGVFTTDVDDSMDVHYYSGVEFDKLFGFVGITSAEDYAGAAVTGGVPSLGYATRFGDLYLGAWYRGNIASTSNSESQVVTSTYNLTNQLLTQKQTVTTYTSQYTDSLNSIDILIGVAGMGIKLGFAEALRVYTFPGITTTVVEDASGASKTYTNDYVVGDYSRIQGYMTPSLEWGMSIDAGSIVIRPKLGLAFGINRDTNIYNVKGTGTTPSYATLNGEIIGLDTLNYVNGTVNDYLSPSITVGAGFELSSGATIGIEYGIGFDIYNNSYDGSGFSGTAAGTVEWSGGSKSIARALATTTTTTEGTLVVNELTSMSHSITPSFSYSSEIISGLNLGFYAELPVGIGVGSDTTDWEWRKTVKTEYINAVQKPLGGTIEESSKGNTGLTETTSFSIGLNAAVGASYALIPGRFTINAGFGVSPFQYTGTNTKYSRGSANQTYTMKTYDADGSLINTVIVFQEAQDPWASETEDEVTDTVTVENEWKPCTVSAAGGFTFNFNDNIALDMAVSGGSTSSTFTLNLTSVQVLFSFKF